MRSKRANGGDGGTIQTGNDVALMGTARAGGGKGGIVQTSEASSFMRTYKDDGVTLGGSIETSPERSTVRTYSGNESESGWVKAETASAELAYVAPDNTYLSRIKTDVDEAFLYTRSGGTGRYLSVDANGVWVKTNRSGQWEAWNLEETASDSGWIGFTLRSGINGTGSPAFRVKAGVVYFRGTVTKTGNWEQGWTDIAGPFNPRYRPATTVQVMGSMTDDRRTLLRMSSDGYLSVYMRPAIAGTATLPLTPLSYLLG